MTTAIQNVVHANNTDAEWRTWAGGLSAMLAAVGLVQTADTGQANWTTSTKPASPNTDAAYEVWRFNDASQSGAPIFIRVDYGAGAVATYPRVKFTVGQGSSGSGTITGSTQVKTVAANGILGTTSVTGVSLSGGQLSLSLWESGGGTYRPGILHVGRFLDVAGAGSARGYTFLSAQNSTATSLHTYRITTGTWSIVSTIPIYWPWGSVSSVKYGTGIYVAPWLIPSGENVHGSMERTTGLVLAGTVDFPIGTTYPMTRWDAVSHTYRATGVNDPSAAGCYFGILWE